MKNIAILGSTGSIGTQALDVISRYPTQMRAAVLTCNSSSDLLIEQARRFLPDCVVITRGDQYEKVRTALEDLPVKVLTGSDALKEVVTMDHIDIVLTALVGFSGLEPTISAIKSGKTIALANKETMVVAGELICQLQQAHNVEILPVDSEHSAIFQSLMGEEGNPIQRILLTASGGPFRTLKKQELTHVTASDALKHPNWSMGAKITIDSASMMNKGFEVIEAKWLFNVSYDQIEVLVHPQSIVHSAVEFEDGAIKAQLGMPDMRIPIQLALTYPRRPKADFPRIDFTKTTDLTFEQPDMEKFRNLALAYEAIHRGGNAPCILNAANEVAVASFLKGGISFLGMSDLIEETMNKVAFMSCPGLEDYLECDRQARLTAQELMEKRQY